MKVTIRQKSGMQYLYADINVSGIRTKCTLGISVKEGKYNPKIQGVEGEADCETNVLINKFKSGIMEMIRTLQQSGKLSTHEINEGVAKIKQQLTDPNFSIEDETRFVRYIEKHIEISQATKKEATVKQYRNCLTKLKNYEKHSNTKLTFVKIDNAFYNSLLTYCMSDLKLSTNSIGKLIKNIKMWMNAATDEGLNTNMIFNTRAFKKPTEDAETIYLSEEELLQIRNTILPKPSLENVKDLFLLACYTGVRSQDYGKLTHANMMKNGKMLRVRTEKTDEEVIIPLHPEAKRILEKYNGTPRLVSNQKFNKYIKEVCKIAGIVESISVTRTVAGKKKTTTAPKHDFVSSHTARRSFATNAYKAGVASLAIMAITGHRTEKVFLKYIRVTKEEHAQIASQHKFFQSNVA
jgi:integrase